MATATVSRRSSKAPAVRTIRYIVIEGEPNGNENKAQSPGDLPDDCEFVDTQIVGDFATLDEAVAQCRKINEVMLTTNMQEKSWAMVAVKF